MHGSWGICEAVVLPYSSPEGSEPHGQQHERSGGKVRGGEVRGKGQGRRGQGERAGEGLSHMASDVKGQGVKRLTSEMPGRKGHPGGKAFIFPVWPVAKHGACGPCDLSTWPIFSALLMSVCRPHQYMTNSLCDKKSHKSYFYLPAFIAY